MTVPTRALTATALSLAIAALTAGVAAGRETARPRLVTTRGAVESLAMDGALIAYDLEAHGSCNTVHVWDTSTGRDRIVSGAGTCGADATSTGAGVREIAVAGSRVSWIVNLGGNTESTDMLFASTVGSTSERRVATATRRGDVDGELDGGWLGNLVGDGGVLALNRWTTVGGAVSSATIRRLKTGIGRVYSGADALRVTSVDSGRIAVLAEGGTVAVRTASGGLVSTLTTGAAVRDVALRKDFVVLLEPGRLEVHLARSGALVKVITIPSGARNLDVHANVATFTVGRSVFGVRLATGKLAPIATAPKAIVNARIDDAGLVYAYNRTTGVEGIGKLTFVPLSLVQAQLR